MFGAFFDQRPWYYRSVFYAVGFGVLSYFVSGDTVGLAIVGGVFFSALMTALDLLWVSPRRKKREQKSG
jgi:hypothetical protein